MGYFKSKRSEIYPEISDWASPHNELRHDKHKKMGDLMFFSPFMYRFVKAGIYCYYVLIFCIVIYLVSNIVVRIVCGGLIIYVMYKAIKEWRINKHFNKNLYDDFLRDN